MTEPTRFSPGAIRDLVTDPAPPCVTVALPTHRRVPDQLVDLPTYRGLVRRVAEAVAIACAPADRTRLMEPLDALARTTEFWRHLRDGLVVLVDGHGSRVIVVDRPVEAVAEVGPRFVVGPLLRLAMAVDRCDLLALTSRRAWMLAATVWHDGRGTGPVRLEPLAVAGERSEILREEAVDAVSSEPHRVRRGLGGAGRGASAVVHGGVGSRRDGVDADTEIFLRHVDSLVTRRISRRTGLPLLLVAAPRLAAMFRSLTRNPRLLPEGVPVDPHALDDGDLAALVEPIFASARAALVTRLVGDYAAALAHGRACGDLVAAATAAAAGRVATLLVEAGRVVRGSIDRRIGTLRFAADGEDLVVAVAELVLVHGGDVVEVPRGTLPTPGGVGAVCRC